MGQTSSKTKKCRNVRMLGYRPRTTMERLRVAEALPLRTQALEEGRISWSAVRELTRVTVGATEAEWLELAASKTLSQQGQGRDAGLELRVAVHAA